MTLRFTRVFDRLIDRIKDNRYFILYGGSSSSKSVSVLQYLTLYALKYTNKRITLSAESLPVIKKTLFIDWVQIVMQDTFNPHRFNKSEMTYTFPTGSVFQFVPADDESRWHGLRQDIVYFDELYNVPKAVYDQADIRTKEKVFSSFNPTSSFWIQDHFEDDRTVVLHSTYKDNQFVDEQIIAALEKRILTDPNFYAVYVLGQFGSLKGIIFKEGINWKVCGSFPDTYKKIVIGGDFGYSNDPSTAIEIAYYDAQLWAREIFYKTGMLNSDISKILLPLKQRCVFDSAEPKSIAELKKAGLDIWPSTKGPDSIRNGIDLLKQYKINVIKDSINMIKELRNYSWAQDKNGVLLNKPNDTFNHTIDASRYGVWDMFNRTNVFFK